MVNVNYWVKQGITSFGAMQMLEEAYYAGLSPNPVAAINVLMDRQDPRKAKQLLARQRGLMDGMVALRKMDKAAGGAGKTPGYPMLGTYKRV